MLTSSDLLVCLGDKQVIFNHLYDILVTKPQPWLHLGQSHVITRMPYSFWGITNTFFQDKYSVSLQLRLSDL